MWIYLLNILMIPLYSRLFKNRRTFVIVVSLQLFLILALRSTSLGVDLSNYSDGYDYIRGLGFSDVMSRIHFFHEADLVYPFSYEGGYVLFNWMVSHIGLNFHGFLVVCAAINVVSISWFIYRYSKKPWLSFIIFSAFGFFAYDFGIIRQSLALSMFLLSYIFFDKRKKIAGILLFVIAFWFHRTVIIALPLLFVFRSKMITKKRFFMLLLLSIPMLLLSRPIYDGLVVDIMSSMGKGYTGHDAAANNMILLLMCISMIVLVFYNFSRIKSRISSVACLALVFAIYFSIFGLYNDNLARALPLYSIFLVVLIPDVVDQYKDQRMTFIVEVGIYLLLTGFMYYSLSGSYIDPYVFNQGGFLW